MLLLLLPHTHIYIYIYKEKMHSKIPLLLKTHLIQISLYPDLLLPSIPYLMRSIKVIFFSTDLFCTKYYFLWRRHILFHRNKNINLTQNKMNILHSTVLRATDVYYIRAGRSPKACQSGSYAHDDCVTRGKIS